MKKLLIILISVSLVMCVFTSCSNTGEKQPIESTTADVSKIDISTGVIKGGSYINKSLGFKIIKPENLDRQSYGDLVLTPENIDFKFPDYFLIDNNYKDGEKVVQVEIFDKNYNSIDDWVKEVAEKSKKSEVKDDIILGYCSYSVVTSDNNVLFATYDNGKMALITFKIYNYDEAIEFINQNFRAI